MTLLLSVFIALAGGVGLGIHFCWPWMKKERKAKRLAVARGDAWRDAYFALLRDKAPAGYSRDGQPYNYASLDSLIGGTTVDTDER